MRKVFIALTLTSLCSIAGAAVMPVHKKAHAPVAPSTPTPGLPSAPMSNPFLPLTQAPKVTSKAVLGVPVKKTLSPIDQEKEFVAAAFLEYGTKVGSINGKTIYRLKNHYLFLKTTPTIKLLNMPLSMLQQQTLPPPIPTESSVMVQPQNTQKSATAHPFGGAKPKNTFAGNRHP